MASTATPYLQVVKGSCDLLLEFWDPLHFSGSVQARNFKFGMQIDHEGFLRKKIKIRSKGAVKGLCDLLLEFRDPLHISETVQARNFKSGTQIDQRIS